MKRAIRYLRISTDRQSNFSIQGQDHQTAGWCERNFVEVEDTFTDQGYSARNFDRPDFQRLNTFILKHHAEVDYLVVNSLDRFSRDAGEALTAIKNLYLKFSIKIVSVSEGIIFDPNDPGSFFYAGLMLLKGEDEIIRNKARINLGIYTAKKDEGRYLGAAPIGYLNSRDERNKPIIVPNPETEGIIKYIFQAFLNETPIYEIAAEARQMGFKQTGNSAIQRVLKNPVYAGYITVRAYKSNPEQIVKGIHLPIIDVHIWHLVQSRMEKPKQNIIISETMPLRGILKCYCGLPLTGAPSRGKMGKYYDYYKCKASRHTNLSATKIHEQFDRVLANLSLSKEVIGDIEKSTLQLLESKTKVDKHKMQVQKSELQKIEKKINEIEEKYFNGLISQDTFDRWYTEHSTQKRALSASLRMISDDQSGIMEYYSKEINLLSDLPHVFNSGTTLQKQQFLRLVFDNQLYYEKGAYRTRYLIPYVNRKVLKNSKKDLIFVNEKGEISDDFPSSGPEGSRTLVQLCDKLCFLHAYFPINCRDLAGWKPT